MREIASPSSSSSSSSSSCCDDAGEWEERISLSSCGAADPSGSPRREPKRLHLEASGVLQCQSPLLLLPISLPGVAAGIGHAAQATSSRSSLYLHALERAGREAPAAAPSLICGWRCSGPPPPPPPPAMSLPRAWPTQVGGAGSSRASRDMLGRRLASMADAGCLWLCYLQAIRPIRSEKRLDNPPPEPSSSQEGGMTNCLGGRDQSQQEGAYLGRRCESRDFGQLGQRESLHSAE